MRQRLVAREWRSGAEVAGAIGLVYDHHRHALANRLMGIQHDFGHVIVSTQHVHLDHDNCLEMVVVRGKPGEIQKLVSRLNAVKGVRHLALMATTTGGAGN